jgi:hypothetical protein
MLLGNAWKKLIEYVQDVDYACGPGRARVSVVFIHFDRGAEHGHKVHAVLE